MRFHLTVLLSTALLMSCSSSKNENQTLLTGLQIIDIETGEISAKQSILIEEEKILDVFDDGSKEVNAANEYNMDGKFALPGLWDMHIHLRGGQELAASNRELLPLYIAHGVTTVRDAGGDLTPQIFEWRDQIENDSLTGPYIYTSGPKIDGPDPTWDGSIEVVNPEQITAALDSLESIGVDYIKIYESRLSGESYMEIIRQAEERGLTVTGHMPMSIFIDDAIAAGLDGIEHMYYVLKGTSDREGEITADVYNGQLGFWQAIRELKESYNPDTAQVFYEKLVENEVYVVPTLHIDDILSFLHEEDHSNDEFLTHIPEDIQETYQRRVRSAQNRSEAAIEFEEEMNTLFKQIVGEMQDAGVKILAGSDAGPYNSFVYPGLSLHQELQAMVESGLTPLEALQTSTYNGAHFFEDYDETGSIATGKTADILILDANPLNEISNTKNIHSLISKGTYYSQEKLEKLLDQ